MRAYTSDLRQFVVIAEVTHPLPVSHYSLGAALPHADQALNKFFYGGSVQVHGLGSSQTGGTVRFCRLQADA